MKEEIRPNLKEIDDLYNKVADKVVTVSLLIHGLLFRAREGFEIDKEDLILIMEYLDKIKDYIDGMYLFTRAEIDMLSRLCIPRFEPLLVEKENKENKEGRRNEPKQEQTKRQENRKSNS